MVCLFNSLLGMSVMSLALICVMHIYCAGPFGSPGSKGPSHLRLWNGTALDR
jgi:hypothetical protein